MKSDDFPTPGSVEEILESYKAEYSRVYGRPPHISRSGSWIIVDYTPLDAAELLGLLDLLKDSPSFTDRQGKG